MKNVKKSLAIVFIITLFSIQINGQESQISDPLLNFKKFYEMGLSINASRVNTNHTEFNTSNGQFNFQKNNYSPNLEINMYRGWLLKDNKNNIWTLKTGVNFMSRNANLTENDGTELKLSTGYLQVPILVGFRSPLKYNTVKNNLYRAIEFSVGLYAATPFIQKLDSPENLDAEGEALPFNYFKFGFISEIAFTALDNKGNGHKFGLRFSNDFSTIAKLKETENQLYPYYYSFGIFYNIANRYK